MKKSIKIISLLMVMILSLCGCSSSGGFGNNSSVTLTPDNASDYLTFSLHGGGGDTDYTSTWGIVYRSLEAYGTISGLPGYEYNNASIILKFTYSLTGADGDSNGRYEITTEPISLNIGGNGNVNVTENTRREAYYTTSFYESDVECLGYEIVSITGTVKSS